MKWYIYLIPTAVAFFLVAKTTIQFKPFKVQVADAAAGVGLLLIAAALICFKLSGYKQGLREGYNLGTMDAIELFESLKDDIRNGR